MKKIMMILVMVAAVVLPTMAQNNQEQLNVQFQSTSTLQGSGSQYSASPALNEDGTAAYNPAQAAAPKGSIKTGSLPDKPGKDGQGNTPLGDAVLPLLLLAAAFCGVIALRRKRALNR